MGARTNLLEWNNGHGLRFTHDLFRFPGKFHPPLVERILKSIDPIGVVDPMAGVGTVAVEAKAAGIPSLSLDIDPVSAFFTRVKTTPISTEVLEAAWGDLSRSLMRFRRSEKEIEERKFRDLRADIMRTKLARAHAKDLERLTYWFRRYALVDYARIDYSINNGGLPGRSKPVRRFFLACLISSIRRISLADPSCVSGLEITKHMKEKIERGYDIDVFGEFERRAELAIRRMGEYTSFLEENGTSHTPAYVAQTDCARLPELAQPDGFKSDLIFFSPPYCNAIEYWRRHRLEYFLGRFLDEEEAVALKRKFIGRTVFGGTVPDIKPIGYRPVDNLISDLVDGGRSHKAGVLWQYFGDMLKRLEVFYDYLPENGHCIIVVGDSQTGRMKIPTAKTLAWLGESVGFNHLKTWRYKIKNRVMQFPVKPHPKIERESILVFQKNDN